MSRGSQAGELRQEQDLVAQDFRPDQMPIVVNLDVMLARRKLQLNTVAERIGITPQNLSVLNAGRARAIRFSTLEKLCEALDCQPGDLLAHETKSRLR
jgi:putative transcriptional regulator